MNKAANIQGVADALIAHAEKCGVVLTIDAVPQQPLAMGNIKMVAHAREARHQPPPPPFDLDYACSEAMRRILRHISAVAFDEIQELRDGFEDALQELDSRMGPHIVQARCRVFRDQFRDWLWRKP